MFSKSYSPSRSRSSTRCGFPSARPIRANCSLQSTMRPASLSTMPSKVASAKTANRSRLSRKAASRS